MPLVVDNDATALACYEQRHEAGLGNADFAVIVLDEVIRCGLIIQGRLVQGASRIAGEIGHISVYPEGRFCVCGNQGCLETMAGVKGIIESYASLAYTEQENAPTIEAVAALADEGDNAAARAFDVAAEGLGRGIATLINLFGLHRVTLYVPPSLVAQNGHLAPMLLRGTQQAVARYAFSQLARHWTLVSKPIDDTLSARAGAVMALMRYFPDVPSL
jgi:predicted NBD/HSP70 family sugar kinase